MEPSFTMNDLDEQTTEWIKQEIQRTGLSAKDVIHQLIRRGLEAERQTTHQMQANVSQPNDLIEAGRAYAVWSPDQAFSAAAALLEALEEDKKTHE